jgi:hypothetical protein
MKDERTLEISYDVLSLSTICVPKGTAFVRRSRAGSAFNLGGV